MRRRAKPGRRRGRVLARAVLTLGALWGCGGAERAAAPPAVARIDFAAPPRVLTEGDTATLVVRLYDAHGAAVASRPVTFTTLTPELLRVDSLTGAAQALAVGPATIAAEREGQRAVLQLAVQPGVPVRLAFADAERALLVGDTVTPRVFAYTAAGFRLPPREVWYASGAPAVASVDSVGGLVRALAAGTAPLVARLGALASPPLLLTIRPTPAVRLSLGPDTLRLAIGQSATLAARAYDAAGRETTAGSVRFASADTLVARVDPTTGAVAPIGGGVTILRATADGLAATLPVAVSGPPAGTYAIDLRFVTAASPDLVALARAAAARWAQVIVRALEPARLDIPAGQCGTGTPSLHETVPNLVVFVRLDTLDGPGNSAGRGGPCMVRTTAGTAAFPVGLPVVGTITLDSVDLRAILTLGQRRLAQDLILHETGHVLGLGVLWGQRDAAGQPLFVPNLTDPTADLVYVRDGAMQASAALGFTGTSAPVPVENTGGATTRGVHWRESVYGSELMTGYLNAANPLSALTVGALRDLGYTTSTATADPILPNGTPGARIAAVPQAVRATGFAGLAFDGQVVFPRFAVDRRGRVSRLPNRR